MQFLLFIHIQIQSSCLFIFFLFLIKAYEFTSEYITRISYLYLNF